MTTPASNQKWLPAGLAVAAIGIWGYNVLQIVIAVEYPLEVSDVAEAPIDAAPERLLQAPAPPYIGDFRDPFHPLKAPSRPMKEIPTPLAQYSLLAIIGETAILEDSTGTAHVAAAGDTLGPYTLQVPAANAVRLSSGRYTKTIYLLE
ncbi:MAG: hypothetical protein SH809_05150 [Rhodothermales bacterium]|nr:hypothetical protein [Rhodothermales bacterium]